MESKKDRLFKEYMSLLEMQQFDSSELDYSVLDKHISMLQMMNVVESSSISIFDLYKKDHIYISSGFENQLGWSVSEAEKQGHQYMDSRIHPDDLIKLLEAGIHFIRLAFFQVPFQEWKNYKIMNDYRLRNANGDYVRVIEQHLCLELDKRGNVWLDLSILDINPDQDIKAPFRCRGMNYKTGEVLPNPPDLHEDDILSHREKEVLKLVAGGLASKQIADKLFISTNTVNTHRQRIIEKLNVSNTAEAIRYASELGWL
jgi:DNA-binding CsgD family transcriptional regulator